MDWVDRSTSLGFLAADVLRSGIMFRFVSIDANNDPSIVKEIII